MYKLKDADWHLYLFKEIKIPIDTKTEVDYYNDNIKHSNSDVNSMN